MKYNCIEVLEDFKIQEGCSERELARRIGIPSSQLTRYLKGTLPEFKAAVKIANYFKCSLNYLFGLEDKFVENENLIQLNEFGFFEKYDKLLKENGLTHYELSKKIEICETSLRIWKKHILPSTLAVLEIATYFGVKVDYLVAM